MLTLRRAEDRGQADHGWLKSAHTFSFADYFDRNQMAFSDLRVINEDFVAGGAGFPTHGHRDMEIITYVVGGAVAHKDSMGNETTISPGEVQRMSAGTGVRHSEFNPLAKETLHLYQIWIMPKQEGIEPSYEQKSFADEIKNQKLTLVVSPDGEGSSLKINQDAKMYIGNLKKNENYDLNLKKDRNYWLQVIRGSVKAKDLSLKTSDGLAIKAEDMLEIIPAEDTEFLLFDLK